MFKISSCLVCDSYEKQLMHSRGGEAVFHLPNSAVTISEFINSWEDRVGFSLHWLYDSRVQWSVVLSVCLLSFLTIAWIEWRHELLEICPAAAVCLWMSVKTNECTSLSKVEEVCRGAQHLWPGYNRVRHKVISDPRLHTNYYVEHSVFVCKVS